MGKPKWEKLEEKALELEEKNKKIKAAEMYKKAALVALEEGFTEDAQFLFEKAQQLMNEVLKETGVKIATEEEIDNDVLVIERRGKIEMEKGDFATAALLFQAAMAICKNSAKREELAKLYNKCKENIK